MSLPVVRPAAAEDVCHLERRSHRPLQKYAGGVGSGGMGAGCGSRSKGLVVAHTVLVARLGYPAVVAMLRCTSAAGSGVHRRRFPARAWRTRAAKNGCHEFGGAAALARKRAGLNLRWTIELRHRLRKSGCRIEARQRKAGAMLGLVDRKLFRRTEYRLPVRIEVITSVTPREILISLIAMKLAPSSDKPALLVADLELASGQPGRTDKPHPQRPPLMGPTIGAVCPVRRT